MTGMRAAVMVLAAVSVFSAGAAAGETVSVIVKKTSIRRDRQFFSPTVAEALFKESLAVIEKDRDWLKVRHRSAEGWIHVSAVSSKIGGKGKGLPFFGGGDDPSSLSEDEVTLAGKGFSKRVESEYKRKNPGLNFAEVDKMEEIHVADEALADFYRSGELQPRETGK